MNKQNTKKFEQLGMPYGTACNRLRKMVLFNLLIKHGENMCYRCGRSIEDVKDLSIEHKKHWLDRDVALFWDLDNIAFSHLSCNSKHKRPMKKKIGRLHGILKYKSESCRCETCKEAKRAENESYRRKAKNSPL